MCSSTAANLDGDHLGEVAQLIEEAALRPDSANWRGLEDRTEAMAAEDEVQELNSALRSHLPWDVCWRPAASTTDRDAPCWTGPPGTPYSHWT